MSEDQTSHIELTGDIVAAYVSNNQIGAGDVPALIAQIYQAVSGLGAEPTAAEPELPKGAVSARKSLANPAHILSMIDGKAYKTLRRHLGVHGHTPESYRAAYGLPRDYPMTSASYGEQRRALAHKSGLGQKRAPEPVAAPAPAPEPTAPARKRRTGTIKAFADG